MDHFYNEHHHHAPKVGPLSPHCQRHDKVGALVHKISRPLQGSQVAWEYSAGRAANIYYASLWTLKSFGHINYAYFMHMISYHTVILKFMETQRNRRHPFHTYANQTILFPFPPMSQYHNSAWPLTQPASKIHPCHYSVSGMGTLKQRPKFKHGCKSLFEAPPHQIVPPSPELKGYPVWIFQLWKLMKFRSVFCFLF